MQPLFSSLIVTHHLRNLKSAEFWSLFRIIASRARGINCLYNVHLNIERVGEIMYENNLYISVTNV